MQNPDNHTRVTRSRVEGNTVKRRESSSEYKGVVFMKANGKTPSWRVAIWNTKERKTMSLGKNKCIYIYIYIFTTRMTNKDRITVPRHFS